MEKLAGTWRGEYRINHGTEQEPESRYFHFQIRVEEDEDGFEGKFKDLTLKTTDSHLHGFVEEDFISFVRHAEQAEEFFEFLNFQIANKDKVLDFVFNGNWIEEESTFQGVWEIEIEAEYDSLQTNHMFNEYRTGEWYLRKF